MSDAQIRLGGPDRASIMAASLFLNGLFIHPNVKNNDLQLHQFLLRICFVNGMASFGGEADADIAQFRSLTDNSLDSLKAEEIYGIFLYYAQRLRNIAHILVLADGEFRQATICGSNACCPTKNGETVSIVDAMSKVKWMMNLPHAQYRRQVYGRDWGIPPFNLECMCRMQGVFEGDECSKVFKRSWNKTLLGKFRST